MFPLATRIAVRIAVVQVLIIVFGVLGTGATQDWWLIAKQHPPALINWVMHWGVSLMWIPVAWTIWFLKIHRSTDTSEDLKRLATQVGLILAGTPARKITGEVGAVGRGPADVERECRAESARPGRIARRTHAGRGS